jgi:hypothetical protein
MNRIWNENDMIKIKNKEFVVFFCITGRRRRQRKATEVMSMVERCNRTVMCCDDDRYCDDGDRKKMMKMSTAQLN